MKSIVNKKNGISLLVLAITIIVIVSLAGIVIFYSINAPINASKAKFFNTVTEVEAAVKLKRLETVAPQAGGDENLLFTEVTVRGRVPENYISTSNSEIKGYVVNLDVIEMNELNIGRSIDINEVVFGETDAFIYDATGKVYYAAGYIIKEEIYYTETDKEADGTGHMGEEEPSIQKYTITYILNGGTAIGNPSTYLSNMAGNITLEAPTKEGRTFLGWIGSNGDTPEDSVVISKGSKGDKTYEAIWLEDEYAITYELNGGTANNPIKYDIRSETISLNIPSKTGSIFLGWTGSNGSTPDASVEIRKGSIGNKHYVANWTEDGYSITYELNGGTVNNPGGYTSNMEVILNNPTREGYLFRGWTGSNGNVAQMQVIIGIGSIGNKHYIANWLEEEYEITYELNGGTVNNPVKYKVTSSTFVLNNPIRQRYIFIGWTGSNGTVPELEVTVAKGSTGNKTYVANWEPIKLIKNPTVTINNGDTYTNSRNVILNLSAANADYVYIKEQNTAPQAGSSGWLEYNTSKEYVLSTGDGVKTVYVWYKNIYEEITEVCSDTITLDTVKPVASNVLVGEMLYKDPTFETGTNSVGVYNNSGGGTVTHQRVSAPAGTPTDSGYIMRITTAGTASPGLGGYVQSTLSKAGAIFIHRIIAKIPVGYTLQRASNSCGTGATHVFQTIGQQGTGEWKEYIYITTCGTTGTFSTMGHLYINGPAATAENPVTWEIAYSTIYEVGVYGKRQGVFYKITDERSGIVGHGLNQSSTVAPIYKAVNEVSEIASMAESITANGTYYIWGKDAAGNQKSQSVAVNKIDTVVPVNFTVTATVDSSTKVTVSGSTTDALSGLHATPYAFSKDGGTTYTAYQAAGTYEYTGLIPNTQYSFRMRARDMVDNVRTAAVVTARTLANIPNNFTATNGTHANKIVISWGANSNPSGTIYELQVSDDGTSGWTDLYVGTNTSYEHTGFTYNVTKYYRVRAKNGNNEYTSYTTNVPGKTTVDTTAPADFTVTATVNSSTKITVSGSTTDAVSGLHATPYAFSKDGGTTYTAYQAAGTYEYTGLIPNTEYSFKMKARDVLENVRTTSTVAARTLANIPNNFTATNGTHINKIAVSWGANSNPSGTTYELQVSDNGTSGWANLYIGTDISYEQTGLTYNATKYYRVRAKNGSNVYTSYTANVTGKTTVDTVAPVISVNGTPSESSEVYTIPLKIVETGSGIVTGEFTSSDVIVKIDGETVQPTAKTLTYNSQSGGTYTYILTISGISESGRLSIVAQAGAISDGAGNPNLITTINTDIVIMPKGKYNEDEGLNEPDMRPSMIPVYWDDNNIEVRQENPDGTENPDFDWDKWYDYTDGGVSVGVDHKISKWANAITREDGSYWVWIPRYAYKIVSDYHQGGYGYRQLPNGSWGYVNISGEIQIKFLINNTYETADGTSIQLIPAYSGSSQSNFIAHPVFRNDKAGGGWDKEIYGFWVSKFEVSKEISADGISWTAEETTSSTNGNIQTTAAGNPSTTKVRVVSKPGVSSWSYINYDNIFDNGYNYNRDFESHSIKNSEWGAIAYLGNSVYGRNHNEVTYASTTVGYSITGGGTGNAFISKGDTSTTGNMYGVYDMNGCRWEKIMAFTGTYSTAHITQFDNKYYKAYTETGSGTGNLSSSSTVYGDATYETSSGTITGEESNYSWYTDASDFPWGSWNWFARGGTSGNGSRGGTFAYGGIFAANVTTYGYRIVIMSEHQIQ